MWRVSRRIKLRYRFNHNFGRNNARFGEQKADSRLEKSLSERKVYGIFIIFRVCDENGNRANGKVRVSREVIFGKNRGICSTTCVTQTDDVK